jgi:hypothetical protein
MCFTFDVSKTTLEDKGKVLNTYSVKERLSSGEMLAALLAEPALACVTTQSIMLYHLN